MEAARRPASDLELARAVIVGRAAPPAWFARADGGC
jgi:hypothetical protein